MAIHGIRVWHTRALENLAGPFRSVHPLAWGVDGNRTWPLAWSRIVGRVLAQQIYHCTKLYPMTRGSAAIKERIEALPMAAKAQLIEAVMTPPMRLRILVNRVRRRGDAVSDQYVDRVVNRAVKRVRRAAGTR